MRDKKKQFRTCCPAILQLYYNTNFLNRQAFCDNIRKLMENPFLKGTDLKTCKFNYSSVITPNLEPTIAAIPTRY